MTADFISPILHGAKLAPKVFSRRKCAREQVNERNKAIGIPNEVIQDNISGITKRREKSEPRMFCEHPSFFSFHEGI
jgi:hypothetical protein